MLIVFLPTNPGFRIFPLLWSHLCSHTLLHLLLLAPAFPSLSFGVVNTQCHVDTCLFGTVASAIVTGLEVVLGPAGMHVAET